MSLEHGDKLFDFSRTSFRFLNRLNAEQDRIAISTVERLKEFVCVRAGGERDCEVVGNSRAAGRIIGRVPAAIGLSAVYGGVARRLHSSTFNERKGLFAIDLGPDAFFGARNEPLQPGTVIFRKLLPVYPTVAEGNVKGFSV